MKYGPRCPVCSGLENDATDCRPTDGFSGFRRTRRCRGCNTKFRTYESVKEPERREPPQQTAWQLLTDDQRAMVHAMIDALVRRNRKNRTLRKVS